MENQVQRILKIAQNKDIAAQLEEKIGKKPSFTALQLIEPNRRIDVAEALSFSGNAKLVGELGGKFVVFISDIAATMHKVSDPEKLKLFVNYTITTLKAAGCDGPHVSYFIASEHTPDDYDFFHLMMEFSMKVSIDDIQKTLPPLAKGQCFQASDILVPLMLCTESVTKGADIIFSSHELFPQFSAINQVKKEGMETPVLIQLPFIPKLRGPKAKSPKLDLRDNFYFEDNEQDIDKKCQGAFCTDEINDNPVFSYITGVVIPFFGELDFNGKKYTTTEEVSADFAAFNKKDLKATFANYIKQAIAPIKPALENPEFADCRAKVVKMTSK